MSIYTQPFTNLLRKSGDLLKQVEMVDVHLDRRDGSDVMLVKTTREESIREGLELSVKTLAAIFRNPLMREQTLGAVSEALPWATWLDPEDRISFFEDFIQTALACHSTSQYQPLEKCIVEWKRSAEVANNPELVAVLNGSRGEDNPKSITRPK